MDYRQNRYYLRYDGRLNSSSLFKVIKTCPSSAYVCKVLIALGTYEGNWCSSRFFVFWQIVENSFFFRSKFVCTRSTKTCPCVSDRIGIWKCWLIWRGENRSTRRKDSWNKGKNQQQTQPTYGVDAGFVPRPYWWEASALTAAPPLLFNIKLQS